MISTEESRDSTASPRPKPLEARFSVSVPAPPTMVSTAVNCAVCPSNRSSPAVPVSLSVPLLSRPTGARLCRAARVCSVEP